MIIHLVMMVPPMAGGFAGTAHRDPQPAASQVVVAYLGYAGYRFLCPRIVYADVWRD